MRHNPTLPLAWTSDFAYFFGLLLGDGSLPNAKSKRPNGTYQKRHIIYFVSNSKSFLDEIYVPLFQKLFSLTPKIELVKKKKSPVYACRIQSIVLYNFLIDKGYIPGRKAKIAKVPELPQTYYFDLLAGLLDTDGGKKGNGFGLSTSSPHLAEFCIKLFKELNLPYHSCPWLYKDHIYHQIYVGKKNMHKILEQIPIKNRDKVAFLQSASVAQW